MSLYVFRFPKSYVFWDIMACSPLKINRQLAEIYPFRLQGKIKS
jgi:hypothetical protein